MTSFFKCLFNFFYDVFLFFIAILALPKLFYAIIIKKKYRHSLFSRFGFHFPIEHLKHSIWIHAVSVGETKAIVSLARELKHRYPEIPLIISSVSETGHAEAKRSLPFADYHIYLPFDFYLIVRRILKKANPSLVILSESDFWFNFLSLVKQKGGVLALVNGKISESSSRKFKQFSFFSKYLFELFDLFCLQNDVYKSRFLEAGVDREKIVVTGNLKLDDEYPQLSAEEAIEWRHKLGIQTEQLVVTIGSTHHPEEQLILQVLKEIWKERGDLKVILVPRHPDRFKEVSSLLEKERIKWIKFSDINLRTGEEQVILMDAMGLLRMCYQLSDLAIVGGSFTNKVGGHNILEPCWYGKPVIFGPHMETQFELVSLVKKYGAGLQVNENELINVLKDCINHKEYRAKLGTNGTTLIQDLKGSTQRTLNAMEPFFLAPPFE